MSRRKARLSPSQTTSTGSVRRTAPESRSFPLRVAAARNLARLLGEVQRAGGNVEGEPNERPVLTVTWAQDHFHAELNTPAAHIFGVSEHVVPALEAILRELDRAREEGKLG